MGTGVGAFWGDALGGAGFGGLVGLAKVGKSSYAMELLVTNILQNRQAAFEFISLKHPSPLFSQLGSENALIPASTSPAEGTQSCGLDRTAKGKESSSISTHPQRGDGKNALLLFNRIMDC